MDDKAHSEREHFFGAAKLVAGLTLLSRVAGMLRAMAIAMLGANIYTDAFALAFKVPNLFRRLFAEGAMSAAFVPVFTETAEKDGLPAASRLLANAMGLLALMLVVLAVLVELGLLAWMRWAGPAQDTRLAIWLTSLMMPFMVTICLLAIGSAALNCRGHFAYPAFAPVILNVVIVAAAFGSYRYWRGPVQDKLMIVAAGVSLAGIVQFAGIFWLLKRSGFALRWRLRPLQPGISRIVRLMGPMMLGLGFLQLSELLESYLAFVLRYDASAPTISLLGWQLTKPLSAGVLPRIDNARYLYQFPMGVLAISLGVAVFPLLSRYASRGDMPNLRNSVNRAVRLSFMEGMATGVGLFMLAEPITMLLFRHGDYTVADARTTAFIVRMYATGMWAYCTYQIFTRAFYALQDTRTPLKVSCAMALLHLVLVFTLVWAPALGPGAFGLATAAVFCVNTLALALMLRRKLGRVGGRQIAFSALRTCAACAIMAAAVWAIQRSLDGRSNWLIVLACVPVGAAVFVAAAAAMRAPELGELFGSVRRRAGDESPPANV